MLKTAEDIGMSEKVIKVDFNAPDYPLTKADKKLVGQKVVFRIFENHANKIGVLVRRNQYPSWEVGAWVVCDDSDGRTYVLQGKNGAKWRLATPQDVEHYKHLYDKKRERVSASEGIQTWTQPASTFVPYGTLKPSEVPDVSETAGIGEQIGHEVTKELSKK